MQKAKTSQANITLKPPIPRSLINFDKRLRKPTTFGCNKNMEINDLEAEKLKLHMFIRAPAQLVVDLKWLK